MFLAKSFTVALLFLSSTVSAQTNSSLPACTDADNEEGNAIVGAIYSKLGSCYNAVVSSGSAEAARPICAHPVCTEGTTEMKIFQYPTNECVTYDATNNPNNASNYQAMTSFLLTQGIPVEQQCNGAVQGKSSCHTNGPHPDISIRDFEILGGNCYTDYTANNVTGCLSANCTSFYRYSKDSVWPECTFGYASTAEMAADALSTSTCKPQLDLECSTEQVASINELIASVKESNMTMCQSDWTLSVPDCNLNGSPINSTLDSVHHEFCHDECTFSQLTEINAAIDALLVGNYDACAKAIATDPSTACAKDECANALTELKAVTAPNCNIQGVASKDANATAAADVALAAIDLACGAAASIAPVMMTLVTAVLATLTLIA